MVSSFVFATLPRVPELLVALVGLVIAIAGGFRTSRAGLATIGWVLAVANVVCSLIGLLVVYVVIYRTDGDYGLLALNALTNLVAVILTLGTWACFLVALLQEPVAVPTRPGDAYQPPRTTGPPGPPQP